MKFSLKSLALLPALTLACALVGCNNEEGETTPPVETGTPAATTGTEGGMDTTPADTETPADTTGAMGDLGTAPAAVETPADTTTTPDLSAPATPSVGETPSGDNPTVGEEPAEPTEGAPAAEKPEGE